MEPPSGTFNNETVEKCGSCQRGTRSPRSHSLGGDRPKTVTPIFQQFHHLKQAVQIIQHLKSEDYARKADAIWQAGFYVERYGYFPEAVPLLLPLLEQQEDPALATEAAWALLKFEETVPLVLQKTKKSPHARLRDVIHFGRQAFYLQKNSKVEALENFCLDRLNEAAWPLRYAACDLLAEIALQGKVTKFSEVRHALETALFSFPSHVPARQKALLALEALAH